MCLFVCAAVCVRAHPAPPVPAPPGLFVRALTQMALARTYTPSKRPCRTPRWRAANCDSTLAVAERKPEMPPSPIATKETAAAASLPGAVSSA